MGHKPTSGVTELLHRVEKDKKNAPAEAKPVQKERRHIYGENDPQAKTPGYAVRPANKKVVQRKRRSIFNIITVLFLSAIAIVTYINNILEVNQLAVEIHRLQTQHEKITNANSVLKSEINKKSAWERIGNAAIDQVGLKYAKERPVAFDVDEDKLNEFKDR